MDPRTEFGRPRRRATVFTEEINEGAGGTCKGNGTVSLSPIQGFLTESNRPTSGMNYRFSRRRRQPAADCSIGSTRALKQPTFKQAGVTPL